MCCVVIDVVLVSGSDAGEGDVMVHRARHK